MHDTQSDLQPSDVGAPHEHAYEAMHEHSHDAAHPHAHVHEHEPHDHTGSHDAPPTHAHEQGHEHASHDHDHAQGGPQAHTHDGPNAHSHGPAHEHASDGPQAHSHDTAHTHDAGHAHTHTHDSDHVHDAAHAHPREQAPDNLDNLILDIGADTGALVINAAIDRDQAEVEISPVGGEHKRTHNIVRRREAPSGVVYAAVFPAVPAGEYVVWGDATTPAGTVTIHGGRVASFRLG